ncbi:MAG: methyltransferase domain-containing protein [Crocinitomicaceae bacterium]|nr:MAG: methyltransferase domain-containing protein [Crocinitomicaceae bacterium]
MNDFLSPDYWSQRYENQQHGWDLGQISPPIKAYIDQLTDKNLKILIPGCGSGHEGSYLWEKGFKQVHVLDFSKHPLDLFKQNHPDFPTNQIHCEDFFQHSETYDLIIEQTLFCAIDPSLRRNYAEKAATLLKPGGKLVGLLFNRTFDAGPPFGGNQAEYEHYFSSHFSVTGFEDCYNSITPRSGSELFIKFIK